MRCNPVALGNAIPADQIILVYFFPIIIQVCLRNVGLQTILVSLFYFLFIRAFLHSLLVCCNHLSFSLISFSLPLLIALHLFFSICLRLYLFFSICFHIFIFFCPLLFLPLLFFSIIILFLFYLQLCWIIGLVFVVICSAYVGLLNNIWFIEYSLLFLFVAFENERHMRIMFFESRRASIAESELREMCTKKKEEEIIIEREKHEVVIMLLNAAEEKVLADKEQEQLRSLIGNVAHDLKTPLQSFRMDLELLKSHIVQDQLMSPSQHEDDPFMVSIETSICIYRYIYKHLYKYVCT